MRGGAYTLDARRGRRIESCGKGGCIDLREHLGIDPSLVALETTSPGAAYRDLLVLRGSPSATRTNR